MMEGADIMETVGVDRNLRNLTVGNERLVTYYDSEVVGIGQNTRSIIRSFRRADVRIRQEDCFEIW